MMRPSACAALLLLAALLTACGEDKPSPPPSIFPPVPEACKVSQAATRAAGVPVPMAGTYYGREIWLTYHDAEHKDDAYRFPRHRHEALARIKDLCRQVHAGADIGALAKRWSNAPGGLGGGICAVPLPSHRMKPDARDAALFRTKIGEITPLLEWHGGFWFAKRISAAEGVRLGREIEALAKVRGRARLIHIHHAGAYPRKVEFDHFTKEQALTKARAIIREVRENGIGFEAMARAHSNAESRKDGGLLHTRHPVTGKRTEWIRWGDRRYPQQVLDVILKTGKPGEVYPKPVVSGRGVDVILVLERRAD